ncbi:hypothetical protein M422DRAFT_269563 [Sphaerobolus stellatus SS14]|uniref:Unplaced genomic scaffold SPHSTscaffold_215, whole genome shotgun sequence n=1 Tax=Sphaerobolus stellatus (strain SS14) TaxID=990650 RepID=A0A0C9THZ4_SPHS4|nr:hypothetical protein M422DRAFT_269563 [Sphaerobolus stellatus SS14]
MVLLCNNTLFRVYIGILSAQSEIFWDMFSLTLHQPPEIEKYDDCPLVWLTDDPEELTHFLKALVFPDYIPDPDDGQPMSCTAALAILRLATRYIVKFLRKRMLSRFHRIIPTKFEDIETKFTAKKFSEVFSEGIKCLNYRLVNVFRECQVPVLLQILMYHFSTRSKLVQLFSSDCIPPQDLSMLVIAR